MGICLKEHHLCQVSVDRDGLKPVQLVSQGMLQPRCRGAAPAVTAKPAVCLGFYVVC